jgi:membrane protein implicated in regulation of membrane protease activity
MYELITINTIAENCFFVWLIIGIAFLFLEIGVPGLFFFIAFAIGSCGTALCSLFIPSLTLQCLLFLILSGITFLSMRNYVHAHQTHGVRTNVHALIGKQGTVTKKIDRDSLGRVKVGGEEWNAHTLDNQTLQRGTSVIVVQVKGNHVTVKPLL